MKRAFHLLTMLLILFLLTGCKPADPPPEETAPTETQADILRPLGVEDMGLLTGVGIHTEGKLDSTGLYYSYTGGEMELALYLRSQNLDTEGVGILLFLDGQPQPYSLGIKGETGYMHVVYPRHLNEHVFPVSFTPVTGQKGDTLELCILFLPFPNTYPDETTQQAWFQADGARFMMTRIKMNATPEEAEKPQVADRVLSCDIQYEDIDLTHWSDDRIAWNLYWNNKITQAGTSPSLYSVTPGDTIDVDFQFFGSMKGQYSLVIFVDGEPVFFDGETLFIQAEQNKKLILNASLDNSDFGERRIVFAVLIRRNYWSGDLGWEYYPNTTDIKAGYYYSEEKENGA